MKAYYEFKPSLNRALRDYALVRFGKINKKITDSNSYPEIIKFFEMISKNSNILLKNKIQFAVNDELADVSESQRRRLINFIDRMVGIEVLSAALFALNSMKHNFGSNNQEQFESGSIEEISAEIKRKLRRFEKDALKNPIKELLSAYEQNYARYKKLNRAARKNKIGSALRNIPDHIVNALKYMKDLLQSLYYAILRKRRGVSDREIEKMISKNRAPEGNGNAIGKTNANDAERLDAFSRYITSFTTSLGRIYNQLNNDLMRLYSEIEEDVSSGKRIPVSEIYMLNEYAAALSVIAAMFNNLK